MGVVYLGRDLRLDMDVAIKFHGVTHSDATLWLKREFRAVASLRHPNLVELYELVAHEQSCYYTMEYLPGLDPRRWVERAIVHEPLAPQHTTHTVLPMQEALTEVSAGQVAHGEIVPRPVPSVDFARVRAVLTQLAEGLAFLHASGVIHRDIKPSNTIVVDGILKLLDFGLALESRRQEADLSRENRLVGTAAYLAPEYLSKLQVGPAMDVYALGVLAFELVTGSPPHGGTLHILARLQRKVVIPRASSLNAEVPPDLDELIDRMLAQDPAVRPTSLEVATALSGALSQPRMPRRLLRFVGRERELEQIGERIADPAQRGRLVLVTGPSGVGKTTLIEEAVSRARDPDTLTWRGRCHERERVPYRAFDLIIDDLASELSGDPGLARAIDHAAALARVFPVLAPLIDPVLGDEPPAGDLRVERERALLAMTQLLRHSLRSPRGVLVIDDLQWADDDSLELLALLVERVDRRLTVVASWTTDDPPRAMRGLIDRLGKSCELLDLPAMSERDLARLIGDLAPGAPLARLTAAAQLAAGNPYLAEMIGRELDDADIVDPQDAELRRLDRLPPTERAGAEIAALSAGAVTFEQLRALSELPSSRLQSVLRQLEEARITRATPSASGDSVYVFYHQRLRGAAHDSMTAEVRRARHESFAAWHERAGSDPDQLAYHSQHAGHPARAAAWAIIAGDAAHAQLAWGLAADWYRKAVELGGAGAASRPPTAGTLSGGDAIDIPLARAKLADSLFLGGKLAEAAEQFLVLANLSPGAGGDRWRVRAAEAHLKLGEIDRGLGVLDDVLERRGERRSSVRALSVVRAIGVGVRWLSPLPGKHTRRPQPVDDVLASAYRVIASFLSTPYPIEALEYVLRGVALAERTGDHDAHSQGMSMLGAYLAAATLGRFGDRALASAERLAARSGTPYSRMVAAGCAGILAMLRGDWTGMRTAHEGGERICLRLGLERSWEASFLRSYWALGELYAGEPTRALAMLDEPGTGADDLFSRAMLGSYRGRALVMLDDLAGARALARQLDRVPAARHGMAGIYRQVFAAELALAEHDWARAEALGDELAASAKSQWLSVMPAISAMIDVIGATADLGRAAQGDRAAATRALATARRLHRHGRASFYAVTALRLCAQAELLLGREHRARRTLERAAAAASTRGGKVDRLAIAALGGTRIDPGVLGPAIAWSTGGVVA